jgi:hypothetical protein
MSYINSIQEIVNEIYKDFGEVRPSELIKRARPENSPAHNAFEWDDKKGGHEYRLIQARYYIRQVKIIYPDRTERLIHVPKIEDSSFDDKKPKTRENYYKPISVVILNSDEYKLALNETLNRLKAAKYAYNELKSKQIPSSEKIDFFEADRGFEIIENALIKK